MAADSMGTIFVVALALVALALLMLAWRHRLAFRVGTRNVTRAPRRTTLLVAGLLVATSIISGALVVGDTLDTLVVHYTVIAVGHDDEAIENVTANGLGFYPYSIYTEVAAATAGNSAIVGESPEIVGSVSLKDLTSGVPQPNLYLIGQNANQSSQLGAFVSTSGAKVAGPAPGEVILDQLAASELNASSGDAIWAYGQGAQPIPLTVQAVVQDVGRGAFPSGGLGNFGSAFVNLSVAQQLEESPGEIDYIAISLAGSQAEGLSSAPSVSASLNQTLAEIPGAKGLTVNEVLKNALAQEEATASGVTTLFLVLGLFSISAGILLIAGMFLLLAEERKGEMGVMRAMGLRGRELVYSFVFEGALYSAGSALAGTVLGVGVGYGLTYAFSILISEPGLTATALLQSFTILPSSLLIAYTAGFLLTLVTVVVASYRASRLNIVRAIRDLPEPDPPLHTYTRAAIAGALLFLLGLFLFAETYAGTSELAFSVLAGAMMIGGLGLVAVRFLKNRVVFTALGVALLVWGGLEPLRLAILGSSHAGGIYAVFVEGIILVSGAILVYAFNAATMASVLVRLIGGREHCTPVAQIGLSYPGRRPGRTTVSLAIFALVVFSLVTIAGVGSSLDASVSTIVQDESGGYTFIAYSGYSAPDLPSIVSSNATLEQFFDKVVPLENGGIQVTEPGSGLAPYNDSLYAGPLGEPSPSNFYETNHYSFSATLNGMPSAQINEELANQTGLAIVDQSYSTVPNSLTLTTSPGHPTVNPGGTLRLTNPLNGNTTEVKVLGVMTQSALTGVFVSPETASLLGISAQNLFLMSLHSGASASRAEQVGKAAFFPYGIVLVNIPDAVAKSVATSEGEVGLLEVFVGLGLMVGIAGMGIVALRAVGERRREIGMLRANGFTQGMIVRAFLLEYSFITLIGLTIGTLTGLLIVWNLTHGPEGVATSVTVFAMPWVDLAAILLIAFGLSMLAVFGPSRAASRLSPAAAVRATE